VVYLLRRIMLRARDKWNTVIFKCRLVTFRCLHRGQREAKEAREANEGPAKTAAEAEIARLKK